ncbi:hypothetical protein C0J52_05834 [Blattella germanica]|nr:hypothetical protein C0J52_05834 [Blattella germanica]
MIGHLFLPQIKSISKKFSHNTQNNLAAPNVYESNSFTVSKLIKTWTLKEADIRKLLSFERKILRKIFGSNKNADGTWSIKTNNELEKIIKNLNIINHIKAQRLSWFGHIQRMQEDRIIKRMYK